jgi:cytochrome P450
VTSELRPIERIELSREQLFAEPWLPLNFVPPGTDLASSGRGLEILGYEAGSAVLRDLSLGAGLPEMVLATGITDPLPLEHAQNSVNNAEGKRHVRLRSAMGSFFTPARAEALRAQVHLKIVDLLDRAESGDGFDINDQVIKYVPSTLFALMLGVPEEESEFIAYISEESIKVFRMNPDLQDDIRRIALERDGWVKEILSRPGAADGDHLIAHLLGQQAAGNLTETEVLDGVVTLLSASVDTTQVQASQMIRAFIDEPEQWDLLRSDPDLVPNAVLEAARWRPATTWILRVALGETEVLGQQLQEGDQVFVWPGAAHRDPRVFADPERFDVERPVARSPLIWGVGRHFCMGRMFAVMEMEELLRVTASRYRRIELADPATADAPYKQANTSLRVVTTRA